MRRFIIIAVLLMAVVSCHQESFWSDDEIALIEGSTDVMRVLSVDNPEDSLILRKQCADIPSEALRDELYGTLAEKLVATVTSPEQSGVGIAGPQVGILRKVVAVQRFDKEGEPFEVYPNISVVAMRGDFECGGEGCLSVPGEYGNVMRSRDIDIKYTSPYSMQDTVETVTGFTAVIFQHECDHLEGILYTDKLVSE